MLLTPPRLSSLRDLRASATANNDPSSLSRISLITVTVRSAFCLSESSG